MNIRMFKGIFCEWFSKRYSIIDQQLARHFVQYSEWLTISLPFYATQIIDPFLTLRISANPDFRFQPFVNSLYTLMFLQCRISFVQCQVLAFQKTTNIHQNDLPRATHQSLILQLSIYLAYLSIFYMYIFLSR